MLGTSSILFPTDFSEHADATFRVACSIARKTRARLCAVHAFADIGVDDPDLRERVRRQQEADARKAFDDLLAASGSHDLNVAAVLRAGRNPEEAILQETEDRGADLIVFGAYGRRGRRTYDIGRTAHAVLRRAMCSVLTVDARGLVSERRGSEPLFERVLIPTDFSDASRDALEHAAGICELFGATALLLHVVEEFVTPGIYGLNSDPIRDMSAKIEDRARREMERITSTFEERGVQIEHHLASGHAPAEIVEFAVSKAADLIVIASRGSRIERFVIGTVADKVVRTAPCSVLTIKPSSRRP